MINTKAKVPPLLDAPYLLFACHIPHADIPDILIIRWLQYGAIIIQLDCNQPAFIWAKVQIPHRLIKISKSFDPFTADGVPDGDAFAPSTGCHKLPIQAKVKTDLVLFDLRDVQKGSSFHLPDWDGAYVTNPRDQFSIRAKGNRTVAAPCNRKLVFRDMENR
jgi:hypothetical protein